MQTFLPYADFAKSAACLDRQRLGKQRVECKQILQALVSDTRWSAHPAVRMWRGHAGVLIQYYDAIVLEWVKRGYKHVMELPQLPERYYRQTTPPYWLGKYVFHAAHRATLLCKNEEHYAAYFSGTFPKYEYAWPVSSQYTRNARIEISSIDDEGDDDIRYILASAFTQALSRQSAVRQLLPPVLITPAPPSDSPDSPMSCIDPE